MNTSRFLPEAKATSYAVLVNLLAQSLRTFLTTTVLWCILRVSTYRRRTAPIVRCTNRVTNCLGRQEARLCGPVAAGSYEAPPATSKVIVVPLVNWR